MKPRRFLTVALLLIIGAFGGAAYCLTQPAYVSATLFDLSTEPRWMSGDTITVDPRGECLLRADLSQTDRERLADTLARSVNAYRLEVWRSELDSAAYKASYWERLDVAVRNRSDKLVARARKEMSKLEPLDGVPNLEQRLINCAA